MVWCATSRDLDGKGGVYCENSDIATISSKDPSRMTINDLKDDRGVMPYALDPDSAHRLWGLSEQLTGDYARRADRAPHEGRESPGLR
jgi:hypothetical protein